MPIVSDVTVLGTGTAVGGSKPDSITYANGDIWVEYGNGANSTGGSGFSTIVEYDRNGDVDTTFHVAGSVDGLKYDKFTHRIWALQNQDGNSTLTIIDPITGAMTGPLDYAHTSHLRGFDDVIFTRHTVYLSYTNPVGAPDPVLVVLKEGNHPHGLLHIISPILRDGADGTNTETGKIGHVPLNDPDSIKQAPNGDFIFTSGGDNTIVDIHNPGTMFQTVSFTKVKGVPPGAPNGTLDDVIKPDAHSGTFYVAAGSANDVISFHASRLNLHDYYVSIGDFFGQVNPHTGHFTALVSAPGAHGAIFVADRHSVPDTSGLHHSEVHGASLHGDHDGWLFA